VAFERRGGEGTARVGRTSAAPSFTPCEADFSLLPERRLHAKRLLQTAALAVMTAAVAAIGPNGALADEKTATFTIQLSGAAEVCPTAPGTCGGPGTGTATITIDRNARTGLLLDHDAKRGASALGGSYP
jgi:hypothetical protein